MNLGIVIHSNDPETVWNAVRLANYSEQKGDSVRIFLLGHGVEAESIKIDQFPVETELHKFVEMGGVILACGTCLKIRHKEGTNLCPVSTMADLHELIGQSDRVLTF